MNRYEETGYPYDLCIRNEEGEVITKIEVKATRGLDRCYFEVRSHNTMTGSSDRVHHAQHSIARQYHRPRVCGWCSVCLVGDALCGMSRQEDCAGVIGISRHANAAMVEEGWVGGRVG